MAVKAAFPVSRAETSVVSFRLINRGLGDLRLLDEALHLAGGLQLTGYRHVLATLWSIPDAAAPAVAEAIYAHLCHPGPGHPGPDDRAEVALGPARPAPRGHLAALGPSRELLLWVPYIHLGP